ncbi:MAG: stage II sporulation protein M [Polyangiales bacterium]
MQGFDINHFIEERTPSWSRLEQLLRRIEDGGLASLELSTARELGKLYRAVSSDLMRARTERVNASVVDYLNDVVARAYTVIHGAPARADRRLLAFLSSGFPRLVRAEWRAIALSASILFSGACVGAVFVATDPHSLGALIPDSHQQLTPGERVGREESGKRSASADQAVAFSGWLFTHNIQVSFAVFALGITCGIGTIAMLFYNGVPLGALAMQYHGSGLGTFFWAWILPHGIPELTVVCIAGGAGLIVARGIWLPGRRSRREALVAEATRAAALVLGGMPLLVLAGAIEGTISQMHEPTLPYAAKLAFAGLVGAGVYYYLLVAGRDAERAKSPRAD